MPPRGRIARRPASCAPLLPRPSAAVCARSPWRPGSLWANWKPVPVTPQAASGWRRWRGRLRRRATAASPGAPGRHSTAPPLERQCVDAVPAHLVVEVLDVDPGRARRLADVAVRLAEAAGDVVPLEFLDDPLL